MESINGIAIVTPIPRINVRRGRCFLVMNMSYALPPLLCHVFKELSGLEAGPTYRTYLREADAEDRGSIDPGVLRFERRHRAQRIAIGLAVVQARFHAQPETPAS